jgi:hypothetical protein
MKLAASEAQAFVVGVRDSQLLQMITPERTGVG